MTIRLLGRSVAAALCVVLCASCAHFGGGARIAQPGHGVIEVQCDADEWIAIFLGEQGTLSVESDAGTAELPVGDYVLTRCTVSSTDGDDVTWRITGSLPRYDDAEPVHIVDNQKTTVRVGPPFTSHLGHSRRGTDLSFQMWLSDGARLVYYPSALSRTGGRPEAPAMEVRDPQGKVVAKGSFRYG